MNIEHANFFLCPVGTLVWVWCYSGKKNADSRWYAATVLEHQTAHAGTVPNYYVELFRPDEYVRGKDRIRMCIYTSAHVVPRHDDTPPPSFMVDNRS